MSSQDSLWTKIGDLGFFGWASPLTIPYFDDKSFQTTPLSAISSFCYRMYDLKDFLILILFPAV
jgi:hypothetical protein